MTVRFYSSIAQETQLTGSITGVSTTMVVAAVTGFPSSTPYTLAVGYNTVSEELVTVTGTSGTTLTITRGSDGTSAIAHNTGDKVRHVSSARDFADSRSHENATTDIHGVPPGAAIVATTGAQAISGKTFSTSTWSGGTINGTIAAAGGTFNGGTFVLPTLTSPIINNPVINTITPLGAWTTFTPTLQGAGGSPVTGTAATFNNGRFMKVGRAAHVHIETSGSAGMVIPGGNSSPITWNLPATLAPRNPVDPSVALSGGTASINFIFGLGLGHSIYTSAQTGFIVWYTTTNGASTTFDGTALKAGYPVSMDLTYECAT